ncbi:hypothetical protein GCM10009579_71300 [Streptomyces javensis]|uniref:Uncharacterized protein n=1 Tax=Streptomyces javensis TaxID=114698 RepID=A0ABP4I2V2_9ACTN
MDSEIHGAAAEWFRGGGRCDEREQCGGERADEGGADRSDHENFPSRLRKVPERFRNVGRTLEAAVSRVKGSLTR